MKTPRETLLQRHQAAEPKLDQIREIIVADLSRRHDARQLSLPVAAALKLWRELILPCRRTWAGLAALWFVIAVFNLTHSQRSQPVAANSATQVTEMRDVFEEQRRALAELVGVSPVTQPAARPRRDELQPRSEFQPDLLAA
ncbi:MAG TPA: hypothetical protein PKA41_07520 [Verrucomicrobiota bacterium]|nr:hypothetical protein [Verrucomicrobiota bacterium]